MTREALTVIIKGV